MKPRIGVLLLNLGSPDHPTIPAVRRYLDQFLSDPRVLDINPIGRRLLLSGIILRFRPKKSAAAYRTIWGEGGSPLIQHTAALCKAVAAQLPEQVPCTYAMRYQNPSIAAAMDTFLKAGVEKLVVFPLYPQYASSSTGSCLQEVYKEVGKHWNAMSISVVPPFYDHKGYIKALAAVARDAVPDLDQFDHYLMSFHGLPERHVRKCDVSGNHCLQAENCCSQIMDHNAFCYRAQSFRTASLLAEALDISLDNYDVCFQSRLGRTPWIQPYTDVLIEDLPKDGIRNVLVFSPSFTADCLETLEEIGIRGQESFRAAGGERLQLVPSLNTHPVWVQSVMQMLGETCPELAEVSPSVESAAQDA